MKLRLNEFTSVAYVKAQWSGGLSLLKVCVLRTSNVFGLQTTACEMCAEMVAEDLKIAQRHALLKAHGLEVPVSVES